MIGIIGPTSDTTRTRVAEQLEPTGVETLISPELPDDTTKFTALYLIGTSAVSQCATANPDCHLIPVNTLPIPDTLSPRDVPESIQCLETNDFTPQSFPTLTLSQADHHITTGIFDLLVSANQVAEIGTFDLHADSLHSQFRADGIAVGTPLGTHGYLNAAGAPIVEYGTETIIAVPLAQFDLQKSYWLFSPHTTITLDIRQTTTPMEVLTDGTSTHPIKKDHPLEISLSNTVSFLTFPALTPD